MNSENLKMKAINDFNKAELFKHYFATVVTESEYQYFKLGANHSFSNIDIRITELEKNELQVLSSFKSRANIAKPPIVYRKCWETI